MQNWHHLMKLKLFIVYIKPNTESFLSFITLYLTKIASPAIANDMKNMFTNNEC